MGNEMESFIGDMIYLSKESYTDLSIQQKIQSLKSFWIDKGLSLYDLFDDFSEGYDSDVIKSFAKIYGINVGDDDIESYINLFFEYLRDKKINIDHFLTKNILRALEFHVDDSLDTYKHEMTVNYYDEFEEIPIFLD
jgi:hypothetical protein